MSAILSENTFYNDPVTKQDFLADHQKVIDAFYLNFFGFLSLFSIDHKHAGLDKHAYNGGSTQLSKIDDTSTDWILSLKNMYDSGNINLTVAGELSRFMTLIKSKRIESTDIKSDAIIKWLDNIHYQQHKPSIAIYHGISEFHAGKITIQQLGQYLHHVAMNPKFKSITTDFRSLSKLYSFDDAFDPNVVMQGVTTTPPAQSSQSTTIDIPKILSELTSKNVISFLVSLPSIKDYKKILNDDRFQAKTRDVLDIVDLKDVTGYFTNKDDHNDDVNQFLLSRLAEIKQPLYVSKCIRLGGPFKTEVIKDCIETIFNKNNAMSVVTFIKEVLQQDLETSLFILSRGFMKFPGVCAAQFSEVKVEVFRDYGHDHSNVYSELDNIAKQLKTTSICSSEYTTQATKVAKITKMFNSFNSEIERDKYQSHIYDSCKSKALSDQDRALMLGGMYISANPDPTPRICDYVGKICELVTDQTVMVKLYPILYKSHYITSETYEKNIKSKIMNQISTLNDSQIIQFASTFRDSSLLSYIQSPDSFRKEPDAAPFIIDAVLHDLGQNKVDVQTSMHLLRKLSTIQIVANKNTYTKIASIIVGVHKDLNDLKSLVAGFPPAVEELVFGNMFLSKVSNEISTSEIGPDKSLSFDDLSTVLQYNSIKMPNFDHSKTIDENYESYLKATSQLKPLATTKVQMSETGLEELSIEFDKYNRYKHGDLSVRFLKSYEVNLPGQREGAAEFVKERTAKGVKMETVIPAFHGTGDIAASMILRYGFTVIRDSSGSVGVTGRMLGDGIYFSNVLDKVSQYLANSGYVRGVGSRGYIFEMDAFLGIEQEYNNDPKGDWRGAGLPGQNDGIISPEWCVKDEKRQLVIKRAFLVEVVEPKYINTIKLKKQERDKKAKDSTITENLNEAVQHISNESEVRMHAATYVFMDGTIPVSWHQAVPFEKFHSLTNNHASLDYTYNGPMVTFGADATSQRVIPNTQEFMKNHHEMLKYLDNFNKNA